MLHDKGDLSLSKGVAYTVISDMLHVTRATDVLKSLLLVSIIVHKFRITTGL